MAGGPVDPAGRPGAARPGLPQHAVGLLAGDLDLLAERLVARIVAEVPAYGQLTGVSRAELLASCRSNLERSLRELGLGVGPEEDLDGPQARTGRRRARQRLPLEALLHSYRLGGRVLWEAVVERARVCSAPEDAWLLLGEAAAVWEMVDRHSATVAQAYREEQARLQRSARRRRDALLLALLDGRGVDAEVVREAVSVLGMPLHGPRCVVTAALDRGVAEPLPSVEAALLAAGFVSAWVTEARRESGLVALPPGRGPSEVVAVLASCAAGPVAVSPVVTGFEQVGAAARLAGLALRTLPDADARVVTVGERLPQVLLADGGAVTELLVRQVLGPVLALPPPVSEGLVATLEAFLDGDGSYAAAARVLYCHRNTVLKRVQRLEALTGLDVHRTHDLLLLALAVHAVRLRRAGGHGPL